MTPGFWPGLMMALSLAGLEKSMQEAGWGVKGFSQGSRCEGLGFQEEVWARDRNEEVTHCGWNSKATRLVEITQGVSRDGDGERSRWQGRPMISRRGLWARVPGSSGPQPSGNQWGWEGALRSRGHCLPTFRPRGAGVWGRTQPQLGQRFSTTGLHPQVRWAMSGDTLCWDNPVGRGRGCCPTSYSTQGCLCDQK